MESEKSLTKSAVEPFVALILATVTLNFLVLLGCHIAVYVGGIIAFFWVFNVNRSNYISEVSTRASFLALIFGFGMTMIFNGFYWHFGMYLCTLSFFHWSEFVTLAFVNPSTVTIASFMLDHSLEYYVAATCSIVEYFLEISYFPGKWIGIFKLFVIFRLSDWKSWGTISVIGIFLIVSGESIRKLAIIHLGKNFTHQVQFVPLQNHRLVTNGIYAYIRHPSYVGWFWYSIGTQVK